MNILKVIKSVYYPVNIRSGHSLTGMSRSFAYVNNNVNICKIVKGSINVSVCVVSRFLSWILLLLLLLAYLVVYLHIYILCRTRNKE